MSDDVDAPTLGELHRVVGRLERSTETMGQELRDLPDKLGNRYVYADVYRSDKILIEARIQAVEKSTGAEVRALANAIEELRGMSRRVIAAAVALVAALISSGVFFHITR